MVNDRQVGGTHYQDMTIEPAHFCMVNRWDCDASFALKHLSRFRKKDGVKDLQKAMHYVVMRQDDIEFIWMPLEIIPIRDYLRANDFKHLADRSAIARLAFWVNGYGDFDQVVGKINLLIQAYTLEIGRYNPD